MFIFPLAFLLLQLNEHQYCVVPYNGRPLVYGTKRIFSSKLCSSRNNFSSLTSIKRSQTDNNNFHTSERNGSIDKLENEKIRSIVTGSLTMYKAMTGLSAVGENRYIARMPECPLHHSVSRKRKSHKRM